ncbi:MAG: hypothetical protein COA84_09230 [Robiginitomaculum sp.]|nr:MAG: hypothetical protein COA84_09230 [Robiginitomaculum sp.]
MNHPFLFLTITTFSLSIAGATLGADQKTTTPLSNIYTCIDITDDAARLVCYDAAAGRLRVAEKAGEFVAVESKDILNIKKDAFGFSLPSLPKLKLPTLRGRSVNALADADNGAGQILAQSDAGEINKVEYIVDRIEKFGYNSHLFYLKNGQVWKQKGEEIFSYSKSIKPTTVVIRRASLGSFLLRVNGKGRAIRVVRRR